MWAARNGHADCVRLLTNAGAKMDAKSQVREDNLEISAWGDKLFLILFFTSLYASIDLYTLFISSIIRFLYCYNPIYARFRHKQYGYTALIHALCEGHTECLRVLVAAGARVEVKFDVRKLNNRFSKHMVTLHSSWRHGLSETNLCGIFSLSNPFNQVSEWMHAAHLRCSKRRHW